MWNVRQLEENTRKQEDMCGKVEKDEKLLETKGSGENGVEKRKWRKRGGSNGMEKVGRSKRNVMEDTSRGLL